MSCLQKCWFEETQTLLMTPPMSLLLIAELRWGPRYLFVLLWLVVLHLEKEDFFEKD